MHDVQHYIRSLNVRISDQQSIRLNAISRRIGYNQYGRCVVEEQVPIWVGGAEWDAQRERVWVSRVDGGGPVSFSADEFIAACRAAGV